MAVKTMKMSTGTSYEEGWHELTINSAKYDTWISRTGEEKQVIDLHFEGFPEKMNLRIFSSTNATTGEEFKIANLFRYANAGILGVLNDPTGKKPVIQYDDDAENLIGKRLNVLFYKEQRTGKGYTQMFDAVAPVEQKGEHISWTADDISKLKFSAEKNYDKLIANKVVNAVDTTTTDITNDVQF